MTRLEITGITGVIPINVYVSDYYGNYRTLLGTISSPVPPSVVYYLPDLYDNVPMVKLIMTNSGGCELDENIVCTP